MDSRLVGYDDLLNRELTSGERLLWNGMPAGGIHFRPGDVFAIPFSLLWGGFAIFWEYSVLHTPQAGGTRGFFALWGIPFVLIGLYLIAGRFFVDAYMRARTRYAVTNQRVLILTTFAGQRVRSVSLRALGEMSLREWPGGTGTITFGSSPSFSFVALPGWPGANRNVAAAFELIEGARNVYDLIRKAQNTAVVRGG